MVLDNVVTRQYLRKTMRRLYRKKLGPYVSEGARLLWAAMKERKHGQADVARALGVSLGTPSRWLYCDRRPSAALLAKVEETYGVPGSAWGRRPVKAFVLTRAAA